MPLTRSECVRRAVHFGRPDRLPIRMPSLGVDDVASVTPAFPSERCDMGEGLDEWGCFWAKTHVRNMGQVKGHPLEDWRELDTFPFPDSDMPEAYAHIEEALAVAGDAYVMTGQFMLLFERMHTLHGFEKTLVDLCDRPDLCAELADRIVDTQIRTLLNVASIGGRRIHGYSFTDDWGTQRACFISRAMWQDFFKPRYKRIFDVVHEAGWDVWMHSCGKVNDIIEDLIEIGLDVINLQQPRALGIEEIGTRYAGRIAFSRLCDIQATLPSKPAAEIREEAKLLLDHWATRDGGFILSDYGDGVAIGASDEAKKAMLEAFQEFDPWRNGRRASA